MKTIVSTAFVLIVVLLWIPGNAFAQKYEVHPYAGGFFTQNWVGNASLKSAAFGGVRAGVYVNPSLEFDGNINYMNHFEFKGTDRANRAFVWDVNAAFNGAFGKFNRVEPFVAVGIGGVTASVPGNGSTLLLNATGLEPDLELGVINLRDAQTFLALNYGGGFKCLRLWGPLGWRGEMRNRVMPNFYGHVNSWIEATGGITFTWGEK
jgi:hypothetical protein